ncbi:MAG: Serine/threonine-protein kinase AfsK [bacterium ADurb.Bin363]|nr:MAG: Serine/threonine-protein kinase AfsK [bacterium ADurb.Bin363]
MKKETMLTVFKYSFVFILMTILCNISLASTITEKWQYKAGGEIFSSPVSADLNGDGKLKIIFGSNDTYVHVIDVDTGVTVWSYKTGDKIISSPAVADINGDGRLDIIVASQDHFVYALKGNTGELLWKFDGKDWINSSPVVCDVKGDGLLEVIVGSQKGIVYLLEGKTGKVIWEFPTGGVVTSSPAVADLDGDGILEIIVGSWDNKVYCIKGDTGKELWNFVTMDDVVASPIIGDINGNGKLEVIVGSYDRNIYALNGKEGQLIWKYTTGDSIDGTPSMGDIDGDGKIEIAAGSYDNFLHIINGSTGELIWKQSTGNWISSSPVIADMDGDGLTDVLIASWDEHIYIFNGKDGILKDKYKLSGRLFSSPGILDGSGKIFVATDTCKVYLLNLPGCKNIAWSKFCGDSWNTGYYKNALSYGQAISQGGNALLKWGPEGYKMAEVKKVKFNCSYEINDKQMGNGDGTLQPGETVVLSILLSNTTGEEGSDIKLKVSSKNPDIAFTPQVLNVGSISSSETRQLEIAMKAGEKIATGSADINIEIEGKNTEKFSDKYEVAVIGEGNPDLTMEARIDDDMNGSSSGNGDGKLNPGETAELWVTVKNNGKGTARDTMLKISTATQGVNLLQEQVLLGNIPPGEEAAGKLVFQVESGVKGNKVELNIKASDKRGYSKELSDIIALVPAPPVVTPTQVAITQTPAPAPELPPSLSYSYRIDDDNTGASSGNGNSVINSGETIELWVTVKNTGKGTAKGVTVSLKSEDSKLAISQGKSLIGNIPLGSEGEGKLVFTVPRDMPSGNLKFTLDLGEEKGYGKSGEQIAITVVAPPVLSYSYKIFKTGDKKDINPGDTVTMKIFVKNDGVGSSEGVKMTLTCDSPVIKINNNTMDLGNIAPGGQVEKEISFSVDKSTKEEDLLFKVKFLDSQKYEKEGDISVAVVLPFLEEVKPAVLSATYQFKDDGSGTSSGNSDGIINPGETIDLWVTVKNTGEGTAKRVSLSLECGNSNIVINKGKDELGNIHPGGEEKGKLIFTAKDISEKNLKFKLSVQDTQGAVSQQEIAAEMKQLEAPVTIALNKPSISSDGQIIEVSDSKITIEGIAKAGNGLGGFELSSYVGKANEGKNPDWTEKGPQAVGKKEFFFTRDVSLKPGLNYISIRVIDATGKETIKEIPVLYKPKEGQKWAVVIGIGNYENQKVRTLQYSASDAQSVYDYLTTKGGFPKDHVILLLNEKATLKEVKTALGTFLREKAMKDDLVFIYYSGHGAPEIDPRSADGDGLSKYIVTHDADPDNLYATGLPMDEITNIFSRIASERVVFFVDSCYSGASGGKTFFAEQGGKAGNISDNFLKQLSSGKGRLVITASDANEVALESQKLGHGIFTYYLLKGLRGEADIDKNGVITVDEVYRFLHDEVAKESQNKQHPLKISRGQTEGEIILGTDLTK